MRSKPRFYRAKLFSPGHKSWVTVRNQKPRRGDTMLCRMARDFCRATDNPCAAPPGLEILFIPSHPSRGGLNNVALRACSCSDLGMESHSHAWCPCRNVSRWRKASPKGEIIQPRTIESWETSREKESPGRGGTMLVIVTATDFSLASPSHTQSETKILI